MRVPLTRGRRAAALVAMAVLAVAALVTIPAGAAGAQPGCLTADHQASTWSTGPDTGGFVAHITLTNTCGNPVPDWSLELVLAPGTTVISGWAADWAITGDRLLATKPAWDAGIGPGESKTIGYLGTFVGTYQDPLGCSINGAACDPTENQPPAVAITSPPEAATALMPCPVTLAAEASDPDGAIDRVEFYLNDELVGTADAAPYRVEVPFAQVAPGTNVAQARAFDDGSPVASGESEPVTFRYLAVPPFLQVVPCVVGTLQVEEGGFEMVSLLNLCNATPEVMVTVAGDGAITVAPDSFPFGPSGQDLAVAAAAGSAGATATVTVTPSGDCGSAVFEVAVVGAG